MEQLSSKQIDRFILEGFIIIENAFPTKLADECRAILWKATHCDPFNASTWTQPLIRIADIGLAPFRRAANTTVLHSAFDRLVGQDKWLPRETLGSFPIRFPGKGLAGDTGWHVDASFPGEDAGDYFKWRVNINSKGRALLMLFLFSDVSEQDAPTRMKPGSHLDVAKILGPEGDQGLSFTQLSQRLDNLSTRKEALATGKAGTVFLCHPFLVHAAQEHRGTLPRFMAQPPLLARKDFNIHRSENELCPVEKAIIKGITE